MGSAFTATITLELDVRVDYVDRTLPGSRGDVAITLATLDASAPPALVNFRGTS